MQLIRKERSTIEFENLVWNIQPALLPDEHAKLPLLVPLDEDDFLGFACKVFKLASLERPEVCIVQITSNQR